MIFITAISLPFLTKEPIDLPPLVSVELIQISDKVTLLVDSSKINSHSEYYFSAMENITCIITDCGIQSSVVSQIVDLGIDIKVAAI